MDSQNYQSLNDPHLNAYFNNKRIRRHLIKVGLINRQGDILPPASREMIHARRDKRKRAKENLSYTITNYVIEEDRRRQAFIRNYFDFAVKRSRVQKIRGSKDKMRRSVSHSLVQLPARLKTRNAHTPSPDRNKISPVRTKSPRPPPTNVKNQLIRRPMTGKVSNDDYCEVTMIYYGPPKHVEQKKIWCQPNGDEIMVMQQHCGGENLPVFKGFAKPNQIFTFDSRRHRDYPFALALYINGLIDSRISVCCEYKHKHNVRLGSRYGLFGIYDVQKSQPCPMCRFQQQKKKLLSMASSNETSSPFRRTILTTEFPLGALLRTSIVSPEREMNRISTVAQTSESPRRLSSPLSQNKDEIDESNKSHTSEGTKDDQRVSSRQSSSTILLKNEEPHHSSEPILTRRNPDDDKSSTRSTESIPTPSPLADEDDRQTKKNNHSSSSSTITLVKNDDNPIRSRSSSKTSSSSSTISFVENNNNHIRSNSSSSNFFSEKEDDHPALEENDTEKILSRPPSRISNTSKSSSKNKTNENLIQETSTTESVDDTFSFDKQLHSLELSEHSHHSNQNQNEFPRLFTSSSDSQQQNEIMKSDTDLSDEEFESNNPPSKPKRRNETEDPPSITQPEKLPKRQYRAVENIIVAWLDSTLDNPNQDILNSKFQLRQIARTLRTFTDPNKCIQLFKEIKNEKIFLIVSGSLCEAILEQINDHPQLAIIYLFCEQKSNYEKLIDQYPKIKGIYTEISKLCEQMIIDLKQWDNDLNTFEINSKIDDKQLLFIQNQLFKEYLLEIQYDQDSIHSLTDYCQKLYHENDREIELIKEFETNYQSNQVLYWYTKDCFIYHMLNRAIRMKDMKILFQLGFLIHDIHQQLEEIHSTTVYRSILTVYRGQGMKSEYFEELKQNQGGLLSFDGFVSTSRKQNIAEEFARRSLLNGFPIAVLFRIKIDPKITSVPFISLEKFSSNPCEYEVLLSFKAIFHIESIEEIENNFWQINLILTDEILSSIQIEYDKFNHLNDYEKLGELLIEMNEFNKAKDLYEINIPSRFSPKYTYVYNQLALIQTKLEVYNQAILYYNLSLQTKSEETLNDYVTISNIHKEIGKILYRQNKIREALEKFQYALNIQLEHLSSTDLSLIDTYDLLAMVYEENEDYQTALEYYQKQLEIQEELTEIEQSDLATTHFKIAICLEELNQLNEAMDHVQQSIDLSPTDQWESDERQVVLERIRERIE